MFEATIKFQFSASGLTREQAEVVIQHWLHAQLGSAHQVEDVNTGEVLADIEGGIVSITGRIRRFGPEAQRITYPAAQRMVQEQAAARAGFIGHTMIDGDCSSIEKRLFDRFTVEGIKLPYGRTLRVGQTWRSNDPRRFRIVRVIELTPGYARVRNIVNDEERMLRWQAFTIGPRGFSLETKSPAEYEHERDARGRE